MRLFNRQKWMLPLAAIAAIGAGQAAGAETWTWECGAESNAGGAASVKATLSDDGTLTISGTGRMKDFYLYSHMQGTETNIPWYSSYYFSNVVIEEGVTSIGNLAFYGRYQLASVTIPGSVTSIGDMGFAYCQELRSITIPNSITIIGSSAFCGSGLTSINIPSGVTSIESGVFSGCGHLESIAIPNSVTAIGDKAFAGSGLMSIAIPNSVTAIGDEAFSSGMLTSIAIPNSVTAIGDRAFSKASYLMSIEVAPDNANYSSDNGVLFNKDKTSLIKYPVGRSDAYAIPDMVISIKDDAFDNCRGLTSIAIPNSVTSIGMGAFRSCNNLTSITIPNSVTSIGDAAFAYCCALSSVILPDNVTSIEDNTFAHCTNLTSIAIPNSVTSIGEFAFHDCGLISVTIPDSVTSIGSWAFYESNNLTSVTIGNSVDSIGNMAFRSTSLVSITFPSNVTFLGSDLFDEGYRFFNTIISLNPIPPILHMGLDPSEFQALDPFGGIDKATVSVYVPDSSINAYREAYFWKDFITIRDLAEYVSVATPARVIPQANPTKESAILAPVAALPPHEFTAGPNPAGKPFGGVSFYFSGKRINGGKLAVYDAFGNVVSNLKIEDRESAVSTGGKRRVGSWDFKDKKGRSVPKGTYLIRGTVTTADKKREKVSAAVAVR